MHVQHVSKYANASVDCDEQLLHHDHDNDNSSGTPHIDLHLSQVGFFASLPRQSNAEPLHSADFKFFWAACRISASQCIGEGSLQGPRPA